MSKFAHFEAKGPATLDRIRYAQGIDAIAALIVAVLLFPFPTVRASVALPVFVASIIVTILVIYLLYLTLFLSVWGRTPGMYLMDLGIDPRPVGVVTSIKWALAMLAGFVPGFFSSAILDPATGWAASFSRLETVSTSTPRQS